MVSLQGYFLYAPHYTRTREVMHKIRLDDTVLDTVAWSYKHKYNAPSLYTSSLREILQLACLTVFLVRAGAKKRFKENGACRVKGV